MILRQHIRAQWGLNRLYWKFLQWKHAIPNNQFPGSSRFMLLLCSVYFIHL